ncbi:hypothetical protein B6R26_19335 [Escherichia coli]|nr:hypothetical protein [Escherichia coli]EFO2548330.1 hypothetical protein [Escherichia coli]EFO2595497.1 hypothetical protein [Escherichia coli]EFO2654818.1 hypothetical protein [Escherichia coli]PPA56023.1 hypothetical protein C3727_00865 [Escherichia coli]
MRSDALTPALSHREREQTGAVCNIVLDRSPRPFGERVRVRGTNRLRTHQKNGHPVACNTKQAEREKLFLAGGAASPA